MSSFFYEYNWKTVTPECVIKEIAKGGDVNATDEYGETVLARAIIGNAPDDVITALKAHGATLDPTE